MRKKVVILTALDLEFNAVRAYLTDIKEEVHEGTIYEKGIFETDPGKEDWEVVLVEVGMGNNSAALEGQRAISIYHPDLLLMVGIAGGLKDVKPGDVIAGSKIYFYESGRVDELFRARPEAKDAAYRLRQRAIAVARNKEWQKRIKNFKLTERPNALVGVIAAGEKVLGSSESETWKLLHDHYNDAQAVEMEGYGALQAAHNYTNIEAMVIRGISDTLDNREHLDKRDFQFIAASHASAFAFEMLAKLAEDKAQGPHASRPVQPVAGPISSANTTSNITHSGTSGPLKVFYSYVHYDKEDSKLISELKKQLTMQRRNNKIQEWDTSLILAGADRQAQINSHLQQDDIIVLGISSSYIDSDDHYYREMVEALKQRALRSVVVIPVLLRAIDIDDLPTKDLLLLPRSKTPINETYNREKVLEEIAGEITKVIKDRLSNK